MSITLTLRNLFTTDKSSEYLMQQYAQTGDVQLLSALYDQCGKSLYHFVLTMSDAELAKDICQKSWLKVIEKRHLYHAKGHFQAWLFSIARNQLLDEYRKHKQELSAEELSYAWTGSECDLPQAYATVLQQLPVEQREAYCLQQQGFSLQQIAEISHQDYETIKSRLRYAKATLKKRLQKFYE